MLYVDLNRSRNILTPSSVGESASLSSRDISRGAIGRFSAGVYHRVNTVFSRCKNAVASLFTSERSNAFNIPSTTTSGSVENLYAEVDYSSMANIHISQMNIYHDLPFPRVENSYYRSTGMGARRLPELPVDESDDDTIYEPEPSGEGLHDDVYGEASCRYSTTIEIPASSRENIYEFHIGKIDSGKVAGQFKVTFLVEEIITEETFVSK